MAALVTLAEIRDYVLGVDYPGTSEDAFLESLATSASIIFNDLAGGVNFEPDAAEVRYLSNWPPNSWSLILPQLATSISSVEEWDGSSWQTIDALDYEVRGRSLLRLSGVWPQGQDVIRLTWTRGYTEVPADVKAAVLALVSSMFKGRVVASGVGDDSGGKQKKVADTPAVPQETAMIARKYRGIIFGT